MAVDEDTAPTSSGSPCAWSPESDMFFKDFLAKYKPSMVENDGTKLWIWVHKTSETKSDYSAAAVEEATQYLKEATEKTEAIKNDDSIPTRANKKKGIKSKKELREEIQNEATEKPKDISVRHDFVSGKWLIFATPDKVDFIWSAIATSLVEGPLASTCVDLVKVATSPQNETSNYQHVMCVYMPNVYDKDSVMEVMKVLLGKHGMTLMGAKYNLYTAISLDSKHASGIQSTIWRNTALMKDTEMKAIELKDKFYAELNASKTVKAEKTVPVKASDGPSAKTKPKLKKKATDDDPFASDEDENAVKPDTHTCRDAQDKAKPPAKKKIATKDDFASDDDSDSAEERKRAETLKKKKGGRAKQASSSKRTKAESEDGSEDDARPKKKQNSKK